MTVRLSLICLLFCSTAAVAATEFSIDLAHPTTNAPKEAVLFPFDDYSIPLRKGLELQLLPSHPTRVSYNPVLACGKNGSPDSRMLAYYGTVLEIDHHFGMWYIGNGDLDEKETNWTNINPHHILYAVSQDG